MQTDSYLIIQIKETIWKIVWCHHYTYNSNNRIYYICYKYLPKSYMVKQIKQKQIKQIILE